LLRARQKLGKYRIQRCLNDGNIAAVYRAYDTIQDVHVALKIPHRSAMTDYFLADFKREARLGPKLDHPNIMPIRDASYIEGKFVIAMPLGESTLGDRMRRRLATSTAIDYAEQVLAAVAHAHENRIIHCDIKPDNFVLFPDDQLKLADFGFSKVAQRTLKQGSGSGTVGYMAPEQAVGKPMYQSDVFAVGLLVYELFSGYLHQWPYDWPPPRIERVRAKLNPALLEVLKKAMQVRPEDRYRDAVAMYRDFKRARNGTGKRRKPSRAIATDPAPWESIRFREFQKKYRRTLETHHHCTSCDGPVSEAMQSCPWCGDELRHARFKTRMPARCPRCHRGVKLDWRYCAWCYGYGFEVETRRRYGDRRYGAHCANKKCKGPLMPFMRYCPWCRTKVRKPWRLPATSEGCRSCRWGVDSHFWDHCPWCSKGLAR
jgi:serine/threonine-protein kinase